MLSKKKQNILITGASGFLGTALTKKLIKNGNSLFLTALDKTFKFKGTKVFCGDLSDKNFCKNTLKNIDIVYYLAGFKKNIAFHTSQPFDTASKNILPLLNFLEAVKLSKVKKVIYISSTMVEYALLSESQTDGYVAGKYVNEIILKSFSAQTKIPVNIVRSAPIYGPGNDWNPKTSNLIPSLIVKTGEAKDEIIVWGNGERKLQFIYIDDLVENIVEIAKSESNIFTIGNKEAVSIKNITHKIIEMMDKKLKVVHDLSKPDKLTQLFKFNNVVEPRFSLERGLVETIKEYKKNYAQNTCNSSHI